MIVKLKKHSRTVEQSPPSGCVCLLTGLFHAVLFEMPDVLLAA